MPELPLVGTDFAGYRLQSVLGRGGMSIVYQAENPRLRSLVALKVLVPELASDDVFRTRFREESQIAASLNHPNVIPVHDFGDYDGLLYIVMRYVPGNDLGRLIANHGQLPAEATVHLLEQAARALDAAHSRGLVHRDVKPGNLLIAPGTEYGDPDHLYLADFGITKYIGARTGLTLAGTVLGTVHYSAPEQIQGQPVNGAADQYSLGCVLFECLTGRAPFERKTTDMVMWAHVHEHPDVPTRLRPDLPPAIDEVIARVLAKNPADRYASCREFVADARAAVAPVRSFQAAPVVSSDFGGQFDFAAEPARRRRVRRRRGERPSGRSVVTLATLAVAGLVIAAGATTAGLVLTRTASVTPPPSALYAALEKTEHYTGDLPLPSCAQRSATNVVCTNPNLSIESVSFVTYPSLAELYTKYEEDIENLTGGPFAAVQNQGSMCSGIAPDPTGENTWNHSDGYTHAYSVHQMAAGTVPDDTAMGRVFCQQMPDGSEYLIWTQDSGRLLGYATGAASHEQVWNWFMPVHHSIILDGQAMPSTDVTGAGAASGSQGG
jgi:Protein kinase domain